MTTNKRPSLDASYDALTTSQHNTTQHNSKTRACLYGFMGSRVVSCEPTNPETQGST